MPSLRAPIILLVVVTAFTFQSSVSSGQTKYRLASYPNQDGLLPPRLSGQDQQPGSAFGFSNQDNQKPTEGQAPIVIDPSMLRGGDQSGSGELPPLPQLEENRPPDQKVIINEKYAGWKQAGTEVDDSPVENPIRSSWVLIGSAGALKGTVVGDEKVDVKKLPLYLLDRGAVVAETKTDANGNFSFNNVSQGSYSLIGFGDNAFFAFGFNAIEHKLSLAGKMQTAIRIQATENKTTINLDWIRFFAPNVYFRVLGIHPVKETLKDPAEFYGLEGISSFGPDAVPATSVAGQVVPLNSEGVLIGRVHQINGSNGRPVDVRSARFMLLENNDVVASAFADNYGVFRVSGVAPGKYSAVAVSADGLGCIGIDVVNGSSSVVGDENATAIALDFCLASVDATGWLNHFAIEEAYRRIISRPMPKSGEDMNNLDMSNAMLLMGCYQQNNNRSGIKELFRSINAAFDMAFYGETTAYDGVGGAPGYDGQGYGAPGYGAPDGCGCGGAGCIQCQPILSAPISGCGSCGGTGCIHCNPAFVPAVPQMMGVPVPAYETGPVMLGPGINPEILPPQGY